jgi:demethylmenaquinone methyltransferase/2-methoxy-6-polyprenyl-1,4-benzoquinol methylase
VTPLPAADKSSLDRGEARPAAPGSRPEGARDEREAGARVREMFSRIAPRYDFLNHLLSFSFDRRWRRNVAERFSMLLAYPDARILDLCCGTGDLAFALWRQSLKASGASHPPCRVFGSDFAMPMVERAAWKGRRRATDVLFLAADSLSLPFANDSFHLVTVGFGFRNLANYEHGLAEIARVLVPGGQFGLLEFSEPEKGLGAALFRSYFRHILPRIGGVISGDASAYAYLPDSVSKFPSPDALAGWMMKAGFFKVEVHQWNFGSVAFHVGRKRG